MSEVKITCPNCSGEGKLYHVRKKIIGTCIVCDGEKKVSHETYATWKVWSARTGNFLTKKIDDVSVIMHLVQQERKPKTPANYNVHPGVANMKFSFKLQD